MSDQLFDDEDTGTAFDESEFADPEADAEMEANQKATEETLASMTDEPAVDSGADYMSEADRRIDLAGYYRELLASPIFENGDENAKIVEGEVRRFAMSRMEVLVGMKKEGQTTGFVPPPAKPLFVEAEVQALKILARLTPSIVAQLKVFDARNIEVLQEVVASILKRRATAETPVAPTRPTIRVKPAPTPAPKPVSTPPAPPPAVPKPAPVKPAVPLKPAAAAAPKPAPRPSARPTLARRGGKAAPPQEAPKIAPAAAQAPVAPQPPGDGRMHQVRPKNHNVRHTGPVPFPRGKEEMEAASASFAAIQARSIARAADGPPKATNFAEGSQ